MKYFKVVRVAEDGRRVSSFASSTPKVVDMSPPNFKMLVYHQHRIISAPKGSAGIFLANEKNIDTRKKDIYRNYLGASGVKYDCDVEVYEAIPLRKVEEFECFNTCQVVRIGKRIEVIKAR